MMRASRWAAVAAATVLAGSGRLEAQGYFGQNHVQYDRFRWQVLETEHFQVHYYPEIARSATLAASMAERSYARLSRVLGHEFREKKPIVLFASRTDFAQNNIFGDLGEGTGGVTDALRQRNTLFFTGDMGEFEHVLAHEMVHVFQYDIFSRGQAGANLQALAQVQPPLWLMEGMAEYLSIGPNDPATEAILRDAALAGKLPTIEQMTMRPDQYFPYRYGESLWRFVGERWGDATIGAIMNAVPGVGVERAFKRELGITIEELGEEWREWVRSRQLPALAERDRARKFAEPLLTRRRTGGVIPLYVAPTLSPDGSKIAYISTGSYLRGEVFLDLYLADARTGKRIKRLTTSTTNPDQEEIRYGYSQSAFSPDGRLLAFTAQRQGKDVLYLLDVNRRRIVRRFDTPLEQMLGPTFSPDGKRIVFQGMSGGLSDLYMIDVDGRNLRQLTNDAYGDGKPSWSPDGRTIAFETERGPQTDLETLRFGKTRIALLDLETNRIEVLPDQAGRNINPQWSPDGEAVAFLSDRTGVSNLFLYDLADRQHYQLTDVFTAISSFTAVSPAISWARASDKLAFVYYEDGDYTVWSISDPRRLRKAPFDPGAAPNTITVVGVAPDTGRRAAAPDSARADSLPRVDGATPVAAAPDTSGRGVVLDSAPGRLSVYRSAAGLRDAATEPAPGMEGSAVSVAALLDSAELALPDTTTFREYEYRGGFRPEAVTQPSIGYAQDNFGRGVFGGTTIVLSDLLGDHRLAFAGQVNGRLSEAYLLAAYTSMGRRTQYTVGGLQAPTWYLTADNYEDLGDGIYEQNQAITRFITRQAFAIGA
ncbi:MAG TPA: DPP IV N-terminal domain-containing protein, partial [Gemmatimonadaceae bacterium]|nr:DPP IV N-terminal domain-containing protein [Gemmatimonadaceae bacterium]